MYIYPRTPFGRIQNEPPVHIVSGDMMLGRLEGRDDRPTALADKVPLRIAAGVFAGAAAMLCLQGGPGVVAPRIGEAPAVFRMPAHPKLTR